MSRERLRVVTEEDRARLYAAKRTGGTCAACGRPLDAGEDVYHERFRLGPRMLGAGAVRAYAAVAQGPVGRECASPELLARTAGTEPERCVWCGHGVYYGLERSTRRQAACSNRCRVRAREAAARADRARRRE